MELSRHLTIDATAANMTKIPIVVDPQFGFLAPVKFDKYSVQATLQLSFSEMQVECSALKGMDCSKRCFMDDGVRKSNCQNSETMECHLGNTSKQLQVYIRDRNKGGSRRVAPDGMFGIGLSNIRGQLVDGWVNTVKSFSIYGASGKNDSFLTINSLDEELIKEQGLVGQPVKIFRSETFHDQWALPSAQLQFNDEGIINPCRKSDPRDACMLEFSPTFIGVGISSELFDSFVEKYLPKSKCALVKAAAEENVQVVLPDVKSKFECDKDIKMPSMAFTIGDMVYRIEPEDYVFPIPGSASKVQVAVVKFTMWQLGLTFLQKYYMNFDVEKQAITLYCKEGKTCEKAKSTASRSTSGSQSGKSDATTDKTRGEKKPTSGGPRQHKGVLLSVIVSMAVAVVSTML